MKKDMFTKFLGRLYGNEEDEWDGVVVHRGVTMATDKRITLWSKSTDITAPSVIAANREALPGAVKITLKGNVLATATINARYLWLLGKTLGNKKAGSYDAVTIQLREWGDSAVIVAANETHGMVILPLRFEPEPASTPFIFWGLDE